MAFVICGVERRGWAKRVFLEKMSGNAAIRVSAKKMPRREDGAVSELGGRTVTRIHAHCHCCRATWEPVDLAFHTSADSCTRRCRN